MGTKNKQITEIEVRTIGDDELKKLAAEFGKLNRNTKKSSESLEKISKNTRRLDKTLKQTSFGINRLKNAFSALIATFSIREFTQAADQFQLIQDRIKVFTGSSEIAAKTFKSIQSAAEETRTSVGSLGEIYNRVALSTRELGLSSEQIVATTAALQQTFRLSGATIQEATASTIQLTQGLSAGALRGQELRSVLESNAVLANLLSSEFNVTTGQLIKFAETGQITSARVLRTLARAFRRLNSDAADLRITFEQAATLGLDKLRQKIDELNKRFNLSSNFFKGIKFLSENLEEVFGLITAFVAAGTISKLTTQLGTLASVGVLGTLASSPVLIATLVTGFTALAVSIKRATDEAKGPRKITEELDKLKKTLEDLKFELARPLTTSDLLGKTAKNVNLIKKNIEETNKEIARLEALQAKGVKTIGGNTKEIIDQADALDKLADELDKYNLTADRAPNLQARFNRQFSKGRATIQVYQEALNTVSFDKLQQDFKNGKVTLDQFRSSLLQVSNDIEGLNPIALGVEDGLVQVARNAGNVAQQVSQGIQKAFGELEDSLFDFIKTGEFEFKKFAKSILDEITRITIRAALIAPIARGISGAIGGGATAAATTQGTFANGGVFSNGNVIPFANGGIVTGPTLFPLNGGRTGLMGEAGDEAIVPLRRGRGGRLGVDASGATNVQVNVINNTGSDVDTQERISSDGSKILDIVIGNTVRDGLANGEFDQSFGEIFGLQRQGR